MSEDNFNLDQVMEEYSERNNSVEELATKDELTQTDFSSDAKELHDKGESILKGHNACGCVAEENKIRMSYYAVRLVTDSRKLEALGLIEETRRNYLKAKYDFSNSRADFYTTPENQELCKQECGKNTEAVFREFANTHLLDLQEERDEAEFQYEQAKRIYESL